MPRIERIRRHYEARVSTDRANYDILDWASPQAQRCRFDVFRRVVDGCGLSPGFTVLDVGCGMTDLATYLEETGCKATYVGVDITHALLVEARRRTPGRRLVLADVFEAAPFAPGSVDTCYCSGVFNLHLGNNDEFALRALPRLARLCRVVAVANFLHCRTANPYPHCHYFDPDHLLAAMEREGLQADVIDDYLENDFTIVLRPPDAVA